MHQLNLGHLVKRAVQVHGKNGKSFTRMQWVNPEAASTGDGIRRINNVQDHHQAIKDGISSHPGYHDALNHQQVSELDHKPDHPPYYLPETSHSSMQAMIRGDRNHYGHGQLDRDEDEDDLDDLFDNDDDGDYVDDDDDFLFDDDEDDDEEIHTNMDMNRALHDDDGDDEPEDPYGDKEDWSDPDRYPDGVDDETLDELAKSKQPSTYRPKLLDVNRLQEGRPLWDTLSFKGKLNQLDAHMDKILEQDQYNKRTRSDLLHGHKNVYEFFHDVTKGVSKQGLEYALSHPEGEYRVKVQQIDCTHPRDIDMGYPISFKIAMDIHNKDDKYTGYLERVFHITHDGKFHMHNAYLQIEQDHHGNGIATHLYNRSEELWKFMGDSHAEVSVDANISVGMYAWARKGFQFESRTDLYDKHEEFSWFLSKHGLDLEDTLEKCGVDSMEDIQTPQDFANLDDGNAYDLNSISPHSDIKGHGHLGKAFLLSSSMWSGIKYLGGTGSDENN